MTPFPDGSGTSIDAFAGTYSAPGGASGVPGASVAEAPAPGPPGWPDGMAPPQVEASGMPPWVTDPDSFVPSPEARDDALAGPALGAVPARFDVDAALAAQAMAAAGGAPPTTPTDVPSEGGAPPTASYKAMLYGTGIPLSLSAKASDDVIWKVACKTGTLALSPGPGQIDLDVPLELTPDLFDDLLLGFQEKAFPYVTVPETHANGALENTGYVKALEKLSKQQLMADARITQEGKDFVAGDPEDTEYLLAGIGFTDAKAKQKALDGSLPDVSVGVKYGYRAKSTGKTFRRALEHLALTPVPWRDGLIPFNPAMALGQQPFDQAESEGEVRWYTEAPREGLDLAMEVSVRGGDFDPAAARAAVIALRPGDSLNWNWDVRVERLAAEGDGTYFLVRAPKDADADYGGWEQEPTLYTDVEGAMRAVTQGVAVCQQRRANEQARVAAARAQGQADAPAVAQYSAEGGEGEGLDLAMFDERKHPRLHGKFAPKTSGKVTDMFGAKVSVGGKEIGGIRKGKGVNDPAYAHRPAGTKWYAYAGTKVVGQHPTKSGAMTQLLDHAQKNGKLDHVADDKPADVAAAVESELPSGWEYNGDDGSGHHELLDPDGYAYAVHEADGAWHVQQLDMDGGEYDEWTGATPAEALKKLADDPNHQDSASLADSGDFSAAKPEDDDTLTLSVPADSLDRVDEAATHDEEEMPEPTENPSSVEELLARHQAQLEEVQRQLVETQQQLSLSQGAVSSQGEQLHASSVTDRIRKLQGVFPPSVLLAAQAVMLGDKPWQRPDEGQGGFNLSVQAPKADAPGEFEARALTNPTEVVEFMLAAIPAVDSGGNAAVQLASINDGLDAFHLSAHDKTNGTPESREAEARTNVDAWEKETHPERFNPDGTRKVAA